MSSTLDAHPSTALQWQWDTTYTTLPELFYEHTILTPARHPEWIIVNDAFAEDLGLNPQTLRQDGLLILAGNDAPVGVTPFSQAYAGHQFGHFTNLGDGRALVLGEHVTPDGHRVDIQLKGSGPTPYSRRGDGRATLSSMLREYIMSEALHRLGIPTTRSLAVVSTGETVRREREYPGAILTRVASSHIRVGTFEYALAAGGDDAVKLLADYTIQRHYPECQQSDNPYLELLNQAMNAQAKLIAQWMSIGLIHGVMNTDNMLLCGQTIDYGPCAMMDEYDPASVFSAIDHQGRYAYQNQPTIAQWNLVRLAETLVTLIDNDTSQGLEKAKSALLTFDTLYQQHWHNIMGKKLGLAMTTPEHKQLLNNFLTLLHQQKADWTNSFRALSNFDAQDNELFKSEAGTQWYKHWQCLVNKNQDFDLVRKQLSQVNPVVIPRNHQVDIALRAAEDDNNMEPLHRLLQVIKTPFDDTPDKQTYTKPPSKGERITQTFCGT